MHIPVDSIVSRQVMRGVYGYLNGPVPLAFTAAIFGFVALVWTAPTLFVDYFVASAAIRHYGEIDFPKTEGQIAASELEPNTGGGEAGYRRKIVYQYRVEGHDYEGNRIRFDEDSSDSLSEAREIVGAYPVGLAVDVFYDPNDPSQSALTTGLGGADLMWAMLLLPFNLFAVWLWTVVGRTAHRRFVKPPAGGASISCDGFKTRVRLSGASALATGAIHSSGAAWITAILLILAKGIDPPFSLVAALWLVVAAEGLRAYIVRRGTFGRKNRVLVIDESRRELLLPKMYGRKDVLLIPFDKMTGLEVKIVEKEDSDGLAYVRFAPSLTFTSGDGSHRRAKVVEWWNRADAYEFASWLRERLGVQ